MILAGILVKIVFNVLEKIIYRVISVEIDMQHALIRAHVKHLVPIELSWVELVGKILVYQHLGELLRITVRMSNIDK